MEEVRFSFKIYPELESPEILETNEAVLK